MPWFERPGARLKRGGPEVLSDPGTDIVFM
jgi:hypothetical protein